MSISIIVAVDMGGGFGKDGKIPWHFPEDFKVFKKHTDGKVCVMGRVTYEDMLAMAKERKRDISKGILPNRTCYVISKTLSDDIEGATRVDDLRYVMDHHPNEEIMILGGEKLYIQALAHCDTVYMTVILDSFNCDRFFPVHLMADYKIVDGEEIATEKGTMLWGLTYKRII